MCSIFHYFSKLRTSLYYHLGVSIFPIIEDTKEANSDNEFLVQATENHNRNGTVSKRQPYTVAHITPVIAPSETNSLSRRFNSEKNPFKDHDTDNPV